MDTKHLYQVDYEVKLKKVSPKLNTRRGCNTKPILVTGNRESCHLMYLIGDRLRYSQVNMTQVLKTVSFFLLTDVRTHLTWIEINDHSTEPGNTVRYGEILSYTALNECVRTVFARKETP